MRYSKADALARRLRTLNPDLRVHAFRDPLDAQTARSTWLVSRCDTILDCTASDEVLNVLDQHTWGAGLGCWHPIFPARSDDVALVSAIAVKALVRTTATRPAARIEVYAREEHDDFFFVE